MRKRTIHILAFITLLAGLAPASAFALEFEGVGGRLGFVDPEAGDGGFALGAHVEFEHQGSYWHFRPNVMWWNGDPLGGMNVNLDAFYHFGPQTRTVPYLGAGLGLNSVDVDGPGEGETDPAINLFGGVQFPASERATLFLEGRYVASDLNQAGIFFGFTAR
jgi:hypothetical protein